MRVGELDLRVTTKRWLRHRLYVDFIKVFGGAVVLLWQLCWYGMARKSPDIGFGYQLWLALLGVPSALGPLMPLCLVLGLILLFNRLRRDQILIALQSLGLSHWSVLNMMAFPLVMLLTLAMVAEVWMSPHLKRWVTLQQVVWSRSSPPIVHGSHDSLLYLPTGVLHIGSLKDHKHWQSVTYIQDPAGPHAKMMRAPSLVYKNQQWWADRLEVTSLNSQRFQKKKSIENQDPTFKKSSRQTHVFKNKPIKPLGAQASSGSKTPILQAETIDDKRFSIDHDEESKWAQEAVKHKDDKIIGPVFNEKQSHILHGKARVTVEGLGDVDMNDKLNKPKFRVLNHQVLPIDVKPKVLAWAKLKPNQLNYYQMFYCLMAGKNLGIKMPITWSSLITRLSQPLIWLLIVISVTKQMMSKPCPRFNGNTSNRQLCCLALGFLSTLLFSSVDLWSTKLWWLQISSGLILGLAWVMALMWPSRVR